MGVACPMRSFPVSTSTNLRRSVLIGSTTIAITTAGAAAIGGAIFIGPFDGVWNNPGHWSTGVVPTGGGTATLPAGSSVALNMSPTLDRLTLDRNATLSIQNGQTLRMLGDSDGTIDNEGTIEIAGTGANTYIRFQDGPLTLTGGGSIEFPAAATWMYTDNAGDTLNNVDNLLHGVGRLGNNTTNIVNGGEIRADGLTDFIVDPVGTLVNTGTLSAVDGARLRLNAATYDNSAGLMSAENGGILGLQSSVIVDGGDFVMTTGGLLEIAGTVSMDSGPNPITFTGPTRINNGASLNISGELTNDGVITLNSTGANTYLRPNGAPLTLVGGGTVTMTTPSWIYEVVDGGELINMDNLIQGSGNIGFNNTPITNHDTITANNGGTLSIDPPAAGGAVNTGVLRSENGSLLSLFGGVYDNSNGVIETLAGSTTRMNTGVTIDGGLIQTFGDGETEIFGTVTFDSTVNQIDLDGTTRITNGSQLRAVGVVNHTGDLTLDSLGANTYIRPAGGPLTMTGGGTITMTTPSWIYEDTPGGEFINEDHLIQGSGNIGFGNTPVINRDTITANNGGILNLAPDSIDGFVNEAFLLAEDGSELRLNAGDFWNSLSLIEADDMSVVRLMTNARVHGGTLRALPGGLIDVFGSNILFDGTAETFFLEGETNIINGGQLLISGDLNNSGTITLSSTGANTYLRPPGVPVTLTGGGTITMTTPSWLYETVDGGSFLNTDHVIEGSGTIGFGNTPFVNQHIVTANNGGTMVIAPDTASEFTNESILRAENDSRLQFNAGLTTNFGSVIESLDTSTIRLMSNATISGGTVRAAPGGFIDVFGSNMLFDGRTETIRLEGATEIVNGGQLRILGTVENAGEISLNSTGANTYLRPISGPVELTGGGTVTMELPSWFYGNTVTDTIVNEDNLIHGSGTLGANVSPFTNRGIVRADDDSPLTIDPESTIGFMNEGSMEVNDGSQMNIVIGPFFSTGDMTIDVGGVLARTGILDIDGGTLAVNGDLNGVGATTGLMMNGGTLSGTGTVNVDVNNAANVAPGADAGTLAIANGRDYFQDSAGEFTANLGGTAAGLFGRLEVDGTVDLAGHLSVDLIDGFVPTVGDQFEIISSATADGLTGQFDTVDCSGQYLVTYTSDSVILSVIGAVIPADLNCDGSVGLADLLIMLASWGPCPGCIADIDGSGSVDFADLITLLGSWTS